QIRHEDLAAIDDLRRLEYQLLEASLLRDRNAAAKIARAMLSECAKSSVLHPPHFHRNAATALVLAGDTAAAIEALTYLFHSGQRRSSQKVHLYASVQLSALFHDRGVDDQASVWLRRALQITEESEYLANDFELVALRVEIELFRREFGAAEELLRDA